MDGKGRWMDNVFIERLWKSVKYEEVYLKGYSSISEARRELGIYRKQEIRFWVTG
jgi:putative transposase